MAQHKSTFVFMARSLNVVEASLYQNQRCSYLHSYIEILGKDHVEH